MTHRCPTLGCGALTSGDRSPEITGVVVVPAGRISNQVTGIWDDNRDGICDFTFTRQVFYW